VMLKTVRSAARRIAGVDATQQAEVVTELKGRKLMKYKKYTGGEAGSLAITVKPADATVFIDGMEYGNGSMVVDYVPVGRHTVKATGLKRMPATQSVTISYNTTTECLINPRKFRFGIEPGVSFPVQRNLYRSFDGVFVLPKAPFDTLRNSNEPERWMPFLGTLSFSWRNSRNAFGISLGVGKIPMDKSKRTADSVAVYYYSGDQIALSLLFNYYYSVLNLKNIFIADAGIQAGGEAIQFQARAVNAQRGGLGDFYWPTHDPNHGAFQCLFGGPSISLLCGANHVYFKVTYTGMMGADWDREAFVYVNHVGGGLLLQF
jgi:hypothetical protein